MTAEKYKPGDRVQLLLLVAVACMHLPEVTSLQLLWCIQVMGKPASQPSSGAMEDASPVSKAV